MFCQKCGCELPVIAKFCSECGSHAGVPTNVPERGSFCVNCGKPYDSSYKFCNYCGHLLPGAHFQVEPKPPIETVEELSSQWKSQVVLPSAQGNPPSDSVRVWKIPYAAFTLWFLASTASCSFAFFTIAHAVGRNSWGNVTMISLMFSLVATAFLVVAMKRTWEKVISRESSTDAGIKRQHN